MAAHMIPKEDLMVDIQGLQDAEIRADREQRAAHKSWRGAKHTRVMQWLSTLM